MTLKLAFSPCPNDTFMFYGLLSGNVPLPFSVESEIKDVEELNQMAFEGKSDITKLSFAAYFKVAEEYIMLSSGSALGRGCGPLVVSSEKLFFDKLKNKKVAVPGINTTANLLFSLFCPDCTQIVPMLFSDIENAVLRGEVDAGVVIHETRFTYALRGLEKVADLGEMWEKQTGYPIPLGCIAVKRNLLEEGKIFDNALKHSVEFAFRNRNQCYPFIKKHAQETEDSVVNAHIDLYVNEFSVSLGSEGKEAIRYLYEKAVENGWVKSGIQRIFVDDCD